MNTNRSKVYSKRRSVAKSERNLLCEVLRLLNRISKHHPLEQLAFLLKNGGVAQLGEHLPCKQGVKSSNLSVSTNYQIDYYIRYMWEYRFKLIIVQRYRSGHNEAVLKTVCPQGRVGSNPTLCVYRYAGVVQW